MSDPDDHICSKICQNNINERLNYGILILRNIKAKTPQQINTCSKSIVETVEKDFKYAQS